MNVNTLEIYPFKPGDWVADSTERVARVKAVWDLDGEVLLDLVIYSHKGERIGRQSPACGGPRNHEPSCSAIGWQRIKPPLFPVELKWVAGEDGAARLRWWAGERLGPANWKRPVRRNRTPQNLLAEAPIGEDILRRALTQIADGHNDPRRLAAIALGREPSQ